MKKKRQQTEAETVSTLCWFPLLPQTCWSWDGRNSHAVLQNLNSFLYLSAVKFIDWVIKLQMHHSHFTVLGNPHRELALSAPVRKDRQSCPLLQQLKTEWGNGNCTLLYGSSFRRETSQAWIHDVEEQIVKTLSLRGTEHLNVRIKLWIAFTSLTPSCLHNQDLGTFPPRYRTTPEPESWIPSSHTYPFYLFHL